MATVFTPEIGNFEIQDYLDHRRAQTDFTSVEFGYRSHPFCLNDVDFFTGQRAYIGIEANLRDPTCTVRNSIRKNVLAWPDSNLFFIDLGQQEDLVEHNFDHPNSSYTIEAVESETVLPSSSTDEIVVNNVLCDPMVAYNPKSFKNLAQEIGRLLKQGGVLIQGETITPEVQHLEQDDVLKEVGLEKIKTYSRDSTTGIFWAIDAVFGTFHPRKIGMDHKDGSFYKVFTKTG